METLFTIDQLILGIKYSLIIWALVGFERYQHLLDMLFLRPIGKSPLLTHLSYLFYEVISCQKCLTFWVVWAITLNPWVALTLSLGAAITSRILSTVKNK
jgi:hypothetical protein